MDRLQDMKPLCLFDTKDGSQICLKKINEGLHWIKTEKFTE